MNNKQMIEKEIIKMVKFTSIFFLIFVILFVSFFSIFNPYYLSKQADYLGLDRVSLFYLEQAYDKREEDLDVLYKIINKNNEMKNHDEIINRFEQFYNDGDDIYNNFIANKNSENIEKVEDINLKKYVYNEDERLKRLYINSLYDLEKSNTANDFIMQDFLSDTEKQIDLDVKYNFLISNYIDFLNKNDDLESFDDNLNNYIIENQEYDLIEKIEDFYLELDQFFESDIRNTQYEEDTKQIDQILFVDNLISISEKLIYLLNVNSSFLELDSSSIENNYEIYVDNSNQLKEEYN
ncbi:MAG: hypothetical protein ACOCRO_02740 [Halanaerobiales bacterium]